MMDIASDYTLAEEKEVAQGGSYMHGHKPDMKLEYKDDKTKTYTPLTGEQEDILSMVEDKGLAKYARQQSANARRDTTKNTEINLVQRSPKRGKEGWDPITFTAKDSEGIDTKPNNAIVMGVQIAHRIVLRVMINNGSLADILSARVYDEIRLDRKDLEPFHIPLKGFKGAEIRSLGTVKLPVRFRTTPCRRTILLDFVVVDICN
ncbi:hypothetical protein Q3G72_005050 [Acer saccharum]|nr:hypothetical protein Q3G72_005050 [Acer saccharum]